MMTTDRTTSSEASVRALADAMQTYLPTPMGTDLSSEAVGVCEYLKRAGFAILPLPQVGEEAVERAARAYDDLIGMSAAWVRVDANPGAVHVEGFKASRIAAMRAALATISPSPGAGVEWRGIEPTQAVIDYVVRFGGMCRDCADEDGVCPSSGLPCEGADKAVRHVIEALNYGHAHGYLSAPPAEPVGEGG